MSIAITDPIIEAQNLAKGLSSKACKEAFLDLQRHRTEKEYSSLYANWMDSPLGPLLFVADDKKVYILEFIARKGLEKELISLRAYKQSGIQEGTTEPILSIQKELQEYFSGKLRAFKTAIEPIGTEFQRATWKALQAIPYGETISYREQAEFLKKPTAYRAVANANGRNPIAIVIPCHRVLHHNGGLGGYGGGLEKKEWLLAHEKRFRC